MVKCKNKDKIKTINKIDNPKLDKLASFIKNLMQLWSSLHNSMANIKKMQITMFHKTTLNNTD